MMKRHTLTEGSVFKALFAFSLPMIVSNTINILFHAADVAVLAIFCEGPVVAAVGACGSLITLMSALFLGLATGANVLIAKRVGANDGEGSRRAIGTSLSIGLVSGIILMVVALLFAREFLVMMNCQEDVLDMAVLYMQIYFLGSPIMMLQSFAAAVLRSKGDSVRPMVYSIIAGFVNIFANVFFVALLGMTVDGVAIATVLSSALSLTLAMIRLVGDKGISHIGIKDIRIRWRELLEIVRVGVPTCFCSLFFYAANVVLASAVNSMSTDAMTANAISSQFDGIIYTVGSAIAAAASVMVAQCYGAKNRDRIKSTMRVAVLYATAASVILGCIFVIFAEPLLGILSDDANVIAIAKDRMTLLCLTYFVTSIMEVYSFSLRALKRETSTMVVGAVCGFGIRTLWRWFVWPLYPTLSTLFASYTVSAAIAIVIYLFVYRRCMTRLDLGSATG